MLISILWQASKHYVTVILYLSKVQVGKKFQLRADAPAFQPSLLKIENAKLQAVSERTSRNVQPEFILFPSGIDSKFSLYSF